jgi:hypothetical protein
MQKQRIVPAVAQKKIVIRLPIFPYRKPGRVSDKARFTGTDAAARPKMAVSYAGVMIP